MPTQGERVTEAVGDGVSEEEMVPDAVNEGETLAGVLARWRAFRARFEVNVPTLVVTHDAVIRVALCDVMERPLSEFWQTNVENAAYAEVDVDGPRWTIVNERVSAHLADLRASIEGQAL